MKSALKIPRYYVSPYNAKAVYVASERQYAVAGGEVQVPRGGIYEWQKAERGDWYTGCCMSFIAL